MESRPNPLCEEADKNDFQYDKSVFSNEVLYGTQNATISPLLVAAIGWARAGVAGIDSVHWRIQSKRDNHELTLATV